MDPLAGGAWMHAPAPVEAEQRRVVADRTIGAATGELLGDQLADARAMRDEPGFAELSAPHHQQIALCVNITQPQPTDLTGPQPQPIAEGEDRPVGRTALHGSRVVRQCACGLEQTTGRPAAETERARGSGGATR